MPMEKTKTKMYLLILDWVPVGHALNSAAHAAVACFSKYQHTPAMQEWLNHSFRKVTCKVTTEQFEDARGLAQDWVEITELSLEGKPVALAFCPRKDWPAGFKFYPLYK